MRAGSIFVFVIALVCPVASQSAASNPFDEYPYLLRVAISKPHLSTCVLLQNSGSYHLERDHDDATEIFEGELSVDDLSRIQQWLDNEQLRKLTDDQIPKPLVISRMENLQINIFRSDHWQNLIFPSVESQQPFHDSLEPLLEWFNALHKVPHRVVSEDVGKNNCLTPRKVELRERPGAQPQTPREAEVYPEAKVAPTAPAVRAPAYLFRLNYTHIAGRDVDDTCAIVYADGRYHLERSSQVVGGHIEAKIHESEIDGSKLQALRELLNDHDLESLQHGNIPEHTRFAFTELVNVWIPRDKGVQQLGFADILAETAIGAHYGMRDKNVKLIHPLQKWVKAELKVDKTTLAKGAAPNSCAPK